MDWNQKWREHIKGLGGICTSLDDPCPKGCPTCGDGSAAFCECAKQRWIAKQQPSGGDVANRIGVPEPMLRRPAPQECFLCHEHYGHFFEHEIRGRMERICVTCLQHGSGNE